MQKNNPIAELTSQPAFWERISQEGFTKSFQEGETIVNENSYVKAIPVVTKGSIKVLRSDDDGRQILLYYITSGESCIMSFLGGIHHDTSKVKAIAEEETEILFLPIEKVTALMKDYPDWLDYIFRLYHKRFEELLEVVNAVAFRKMDQRLTELLDRKAQLTGSNTISITHEALAEELGSARVVVSRLLKQMEEQELVILGRNKITLL